MDERASKGRWQIVVASSLAMAATNWCGAETAGTGTPARSMSIAVSGTGTDLQNGAIVHSKKATAHGAIQTSTEIVELRGDLIGKVLYHVTSISDDAKGILVNTGDQVFSGSVAGSEPVMIGDSKFRFEVNLKTGEESGDVFLQDHLAGPLIMCTLHVVGIGKDADGNPVFRYAGHCTFGS